MDFFHYRFVLQNTERQKEILQIRLRVPGDLGTSRSTLTTNFEVEAQVAIASGSTTDTEGRRRVGGRGNNTLEPTEGTARRHNGLTQVLDERTSGRDSGKSRGILRRNERRERTSRRRTTAARASSVNKCTALNRANHYVIRTT